MKRRIQDLLVPCATGPAAPGTAAAPAPCFPVKPAEMTWHDYLILLLRIGAEIEHCLMVQYLYAAYSLGHDGLSEQEALAVARWRRNILAIAKEEMGHLLTVENVLRLVGGPITLDREDFPWDSAFTPFPFTLEPLSMSSLACYVYAEMPPEIPEGWEYRWFREHDAQRIFDEVKARMHGHEAHHVDELYKVILDVIGDPSRIPDSAFNADTFSSQASWDEWGLGYGPNTLEADPLGDDSDHPPPSRYQARVLIAQMASRTQAVAALKDLAAQGEDPQLGNPSAEPSHFDRFIEIYDEFEHVRGWRPTRDVPIGPTTVSPAGEGSTYIESSVSRGWATLFNLRYRMLLTYLSHTFQLPRSLDPDRPGTRPGALHRIFSEMYNLKTIAGILVRLPLGDPDDPRRAGPPFEMPYTLALPTDETARWDLHRELHAESLGLCATLLRNAPRDGEQYLRTLGDLDRQSIEWIRRIRA